MRRKFSESMILYEKRLISSVENNYRNIRYVCINNFVVILNISKLLMILKKMTENSGLDGWEGGYIMNLEYMYLFFPHHVLSPDPVVPPVSSTWRHILHKLSENRLQKYCHIT